MLRFLTARERLTRVHTATLAHQTARECVQVPDALRAKETYVSLAGWECLMPLSARARQLAKELFFLIIPLFHPASDEM